MRKLRKMHWYQARMNKATGESCIGDSSLVKNDWLGSNPYKGRKVKNVWQVLLGAISIFMVSVSYAADPSDFDIQFREDRGIVSVIDFSGNYDKQEDGKANQLPRELVAQEFYKTHADNYDFLVVFSTFEFDTGEANAFYSAVKNNVQGIGHPIVDWSERYGSQGKLQGYIDMAALSRRVTDPTQAGFNQSLMVLGHELMHRWSARVSFEQGNGLDRGLIGKDDNHWSNLLDSGASVLYGHKWQDNGNGSFTSTAYQKFYSPLDLYLAGFNQASEVSPLLLIDNPSIDKQLTPEQSIRQLGRTINGTKRTVTIEQIIAAEGERNPSFENSQKDFRFAFILLTEPFKPVLEEDIAGLNNFSKGFIDRFSIWTGGRAAANVYPEAVVTPPGDPGEVVIGDVRTDPAVLSDGFSWLREQQNNSGFWSDKTSSSMRDTVVALDVLRRLDPLFTRKNSALDWMAVQNINNVDYIARQSKVEFELNRKEHAKTLNTRLISLQNTDGGWGIDQGYGSNALDTALALSAMINSNSQSHINAAINYLIAQQNADGGWSSRERAGSKVFVTTVVLNLLKQLNQHSDIATAGIDWLVGQQNADGGFGENSSSLHVTANVIKTLINYRAGDRIAFASAADYLMNNQQENGSWANSSYVTAVTLEALQQFSYPNLLINPQIETSITNPVDGDRVSLNITVSNNSNVETEASSLRFYDADPANGGTAIGNDLLIPVLASGMSVELTLTWDTLDQVGSHELFFVVDPEQTLVEMSELDNTASIQFNVIAATAGIDVSIAQSSVLVTPEYLNVIPQDIGFTVTARNQGSEAATGVLVELRKDSINGQVLDQQTVDLPGRTTKVTNLTYQLQTADSTRFFIVLDPNNQLSETNENNNTATVLLKTQNSHDLVVTPADIILDTRDVIQGSDITFKVNLRNQGTLDSPSFNVRYTISDGETTKDIQSSVAQVNAGQSTQQAITWRVDLAGQLTFSVLLDESNVLPELNELNNSASIQFNSGISQGPNLTVSHQDLTFEPEIGAEAAPLTISALVRNIGSQDATNVSVGFYNGDPANGGELIGLTPAIPVLAAGASEKVSFNWGSIPTAGDQLIHIMVDPDNTINEFLESDNQAFNTLKVLSLPDLTLSAADIELIPAFPKEGEDIQLKVSVFNLGEQAVDNARVNIYSGDPADGGQPISTSQLVDIEGKKNQTLNFDLGNAFAAGTTLLYVVVDQANSVLESDETNNFASKNLVIQNADFNVSQKYFSPNEDGVQDYTEFFFRLAAPTRPQVKVVDVKGEVVKHFEKPLNEVDSGNVVWNGLDDSGRVVDDGVYQIQLLDNSLVVGYASVEIDNNRSSLFESIGTPYGVLTNLTCDLNDYRNMQIAQDESKLYFTIPSSRSGDLYAPGLYKMDPNGTGVQVILTQAFFNSEGLDIPKYNQFYLSNDGRQLVFESKRNNQRTIVVVDTQTTTAKKINSANYYAEIIGFTDDNQGLIEFNDSKIIVTAFNGAPEVVKFDFKQALSVSGNVFLYHHELSIDRSQLLMVVYENTTGSSHLLHLNLVTEQLTSLSVDPLSTRTEGPAGLVNAYWRKDGRGFAIFNSETGTVNIYNDQVLSVSAYTLPEFNSSIIERKVYAVDWSPQNDQIAFLYTVPIQDTDGGYSYADSQSFGGIYKLNVTSGEFTSLYDFSFKPSEKCSGGHCQPDFSGPTPKVVELQWNETGALVYQSIGQDYTKRSYSNYLNQVWTINTLVPQQPKQIFKDFSGDEIGSYYSITNSFKNLTLSPLRGQLLFQSNYQSTTDDACQFYNHNDWSYRSLLNLTVDIRALRSPSGGGILLSGTATDKNFEHYVLEYALMDAPEQWLAIQPAVASAVLDQNFTLWIPPAPGTYFVRLTATDLAGNRKQKIKRVAWSEETQISNLYRTETYISPNGDNQQDITSIFYTVLKPVHLEFDFYTEDGQLVRTIMRDHSGLGEEYSISWDGRNEQGETLADGNYLMRVLNYEFKFVIDNTPPDAEISVFGAYHEDFQYLSDTIELGMPYLQYSVNERYPKSAVINRIDQMNQLKSVYKPISVGIWDKQNYLLYPQFKKYPADFSGFSFEIVATDLAGNTNVVQTPMTEQQIILAKLGTQSTDEPIKKVEYTDLSTNATGPLITLDFQEPARLFIPETIANQLQQLSVEYRTLDSDVWESELVSEFTHQEFDFPDKVVSLQEVEHEFFAYWQHQRLDIGKEYVIRLAAIDSQGERYVSNRSRVALQDHESLSVNGFRSTMNAKNDPVANIDRLIQIHPEPVSADDYVVWGENGVSKPIAEIKLYVRSDDDERYLLEQYSGSFYKPQSHFIFPLNGLKSCVNYVMRTVAVAEDGEVFDGEKMLQTLCLDLNIRHVPEYHLSCNTPATDKALIEFSPVTSNNKVLKLLTFFPAGEPNNILFNVNKPTASLTGKDYTHQFELDTTSISEGSYAYEAKLINVENDEVTIPFTLVVDKTPPTQSINTPIEGAKMCKNNLTIDGDITDNNAFRYFLEYSPGTEFNEATSKTLYFKNVTSESQLDRLNRQDRFSINKNIPTSVLESGTIGNFSYRENVIGDVSIRLSALDLAGHRQCSVRSFNIDGEVELNSNSLSTPAISPNADGVNDELMINYTFSEAVELSIQVYNYNDVTDGSLSEFDFLLGDLQATLLSDFSVPPGENSLTWYGRADSGELLADGDYVLIYTARDGCGNEHRFFNYIVVDTQQPDIQLTYPNAVEPLGMLIEIQGLVNEFQSIRLGDQLKEISVNYGVGKTPTNWIQLYQGQKNLNEHLINWNTYGLVGEHQLQIIAEDIAGNKSELLLPVNINNQVNLVSYLEAVENLFSPNADGKRDVTSIRFGLEKASTVTLLIEDHQGNLVKNLLTDKALSAGAQVINWDGLNNTGNLMSDGAYQIKVIASLTENTAIKQEESITVILDATFPVINIERPNDGFTASTSGISGSITDANLSQFEIFIASNPAAPVWQSIASGDQNQSSTLLARLTEYTEGEYALKITAADLAQSETVKQLNFVIDNTQPIVNWITPANAIYVSATKGKVNLSGTLVEKNPQSYRVTATAKLMPDNVSNVLVGSQFPLPEKLGEWDVSALTDGEYQLTLSVEDKAGLVGQSVRQIFVDNTLPTALISQPETLSYITQSTDIFGAANDDNFKQYTIAVAKLNSGDQVNDQLNYTQLYVAESAINNDKLFNWQALPQDGRYALKLMVADRADNTAESVIQVTVDTKAPAKPNGLTSVLENQRNIRLSWQANTEADLAGYIVLRAGIEISDLITSSTEYLVQSALDGAYHYSVIAVDKAGLKSQPADVVNVIVDGTAPNVQLSAPLKDSRVSSLVEIKGTAFSADDFKEYRVYVESSNGERQLIRRSPVAIQADTLTAWNTIGLQEGSLWRILLEAEDLSGNVLFDEVNVTIDNQAPAQPTGLSLSTLDAKVTLSWNANSETDLLGYLIYRNDRIANASGPVIGGLEPFAVLNTQYSDSGLPDGQYRYSIVAIDNAGNISLPSALEETTIDLKSPKAIITQPLTDKVFEQPIKLVAESEDNDIASVIFQYRNAVGNWVDINTASTVLPYETLFEPVVLGLDYATYQVRAVATDTGGRVDSFPQTIDLTYSDLTAPEPIVNLQSKVTATEVNLSWPTSQESDIKSYDIFVKRPAASGFEKQASIAHDAGNSITQSAHFELIEGFYTYYVVAVDQIGNSSIKSNEVNARIYTPEIIHPFTPTRAFSTHIQGKAYEVVSVSGELVNSTGTVQVAPFDSDLTGGFKLDNINLVAGDNTITLRLTDLSGNVSKDVVAVVVNGSNPSQPTELVADVTDLNVVLDWQDNPESNILGYNIFDAGISVIETKINSGVVASASSQAASWNEPNSAIDTNEYSRWQPSVDYLLDNPGRGEWLQLSFNEKQLVTQVAIDWGSLIGSAIDFDLQVWAESGWVTVSQMRNNEESTHLIQLENAYYTSKLRVYILKVNSQANDDDAVGIADIKVTSQPLEALSTYTQLVEDGIHQYSVVAINTLGFASIPSLTVDASAGDVTPPDPVVLSGEVVGSDIHLNWTASNATDLVRYDVYRNGEKIATLTDLSQLSYQDIGLANGSYQYRVKAVDAVGNQSDSNESRFNLNVALPVAPDNLMATVIAEGAALQLSWQHSAPSVVDHYQLLRSAVSGTDYEVIADVNELHFIDTNLENGVNYFYVVIAFDSLGNKSVVSNEVQAIPIDTVSPATPVILAPTIEGESYTSNQPTIFIVGDAEADNQVSLIRNGNQIAQTQSLAQPVLDTAELNLESNIRSYQIANDGHRFIYEVNGAYGEKEDDLGLYLYDYRTQQIKKLASVEYSNSVHSRWTSDNKAVTLLQKESRWGNQFVELVNIKSGEVSRLTKPEEANLSFALLSPNQKFLMGQGRVFTDNARGYGLWLYDVANQQWLENFTESSGYYESFKWSPDGRYISFSNGDGLSVYDVQSKSMIAINPDVRSQVPDWSVDSSQLLYSATVLGENQVFAFNMSTASETLIIQSQDDLRDVVFSPIGDSIYFIRNNQQIVKQVISSGQQSIAYQSEFPIRYLQISETGLLMVEMNNLVESKQVQITPAGYFKFDNIALSHGANNITVKSQDKSQNESETSSPVIINYEVNNLVDFQLNTNDIKLIPEIPKAGETARVAVSVKNLGDIPSPVTSISLIAVDEANNRYVIISQYNLSEIHSGQSETVFADWELAGIEGAVTFYAQVDPDNLVFESDENNNLAVKDVLVVGDKGVSASVSLDASEYLPGQIMNIETAVANGGRLFNGHLVVKVEDDAGYLVEELLTKNIENLAYSAVLKSSLSWNSGTTLAGNYRVVVNVFDVDNQLVESSQKAFAIQTESQIATRISTDQLSYKANQNVVINGNVNYIAGNQILTGLKVDIEVLDNQQNILQSETQVIAELLPNTEQTIQLIWQTQNRPIGDYQVRIRVYKDSETEVESESLNLFKIESSGMQLKGDIQPGKENVAIDETITADYTLKNISNIAINQLTYSISLLSTDGVTVLQHQQNQVDIAIEAEYNNTVEFESSELQPGQYQLILQVEQLDNANNPERVTLTASQFNLLDLKAPNVSVLAPTPDEIINTARVQLKVAAIDQHSTIDRVEIKFDSGSWNKVSSDPRLADIYSAAMPQLLDGEHTLTVRAFDQFFNQSESSVVNFVVDNSAPEITLSQVVDGHVYNTQVNPEISIIDQHLASSSIKLNGQDFISGNPVIEGGDYLLVVSAIDLAGNVSQQQVQFSIVVAAPEIEITGVKDGDLTNQSIVPVISITGDNIIEQSVTLNGQSFISGTAITSEGHYQLVVTAINSANNQTTETINFEIDKTAPTIQVDGINDGQHSSQNITPVITLNDAHFDSASLMLNGVIFVSGTVITQEGEYELLINANDSVGNQSSRRISFVIDKQAPDILISGVTDGLMSRQGITPVIAISDDHLATQLIQLNNVNFVSGTLINADGHYQLVVNAEDKAGNQSSQSISFDIDQSEPVITIAGIQEGDVSGSDVTPVITIHDAQLATQLIQLNGQVFESGTLISAEGSYELSVSAEDSFGNQSHQTINFAIDKTLPEIIITGVTDGLVTNQNVTPVIKVSDEHFTQELVTLNDVEYISGSVIEADGTYQLKVSAKDKAGNQSSMNVQFEINRQPPVISVTSPANNSSVTTDSIDIVGVSEPFADIYLIDSAANELTTIADEQGHFQFTQVILNEGDNRFTLFAINQAGNTSDSIILNVALASAELDVEVINNGEVLVWLPKRGGDELVELFSEISNRDNLGIQFVRSENALIQQLRSQLFSKLIIADIACNAGDGHVSDSHGANHSSHGCGLFVSKRAAAEVRARVAAGLGLSLIKEHSRQPYFMYDVFAALAYKKVKQIQQIKMLASPVSDEMIMDYQGHGMMISSNGAEIIADNHSGTALMAINQYYQGRTAILGFNPANITDSEMAHQLVLNLLNYLSPNSGSSNLTADSFVRMNWHASSMTPPIVLKLTQTLDTGMQVISAKDGVIEDELNASWSRSLETSETVLSSLVKLPSTIGDYSVNAKLTLLNTDGNHPEVESEWFFTISENPIDYSVLLQTAMTTLEFENCGCGRSRYHYKHQHNKCDAYLNYVKALVSHVLAMDIQHQWQADHAIRRLLKAYSMINLYAKDKQSLALIGHVIKTYEIKWSTLSDNHCAPIPTKADESQQIPTWKAMLDIGIGPQSSQSLIDQLVDKMYMDDFEEDNYYNPDDFIQEEMVN
ncbi:CARDB domain-containing protein [Aliikangiella sp. IMCC44359]|uniref:CARDB domain-containing protein n=1 Tax=Aliikangiella sp. IMCC44359 TaxID=3459125 RepID=UPI00403B3714